MKKSYLKPEIIVRGNNAAYLLAGSGGTEATIPVAPWGAKTNVDAEEDDLKSKNIWED